MLHLQVTVLNTAELLNPAAYGVGALLRWESAPASTGPFVEGGTVALVAGTSLYDVWDPAGLVGVWYRTRVSNAGNTLASAFSALFQGGIPTRYAELDDLLAVFETPPLTSRNGRLLSLLSTATQQVIDECGGRDYFSHPATGTAVWTLDGDGSDVLHIHEGLISLSLLELSFDGGFTFVPVNGPSGMPTVRSDYLLTGDSPYSLEPIPAGEPYFHIKMTGFGQYVNFVPTVSAARLTGVRGWPAFPPSLVEATAQRARQLAYAEGSYSGSMAGGPDEFGRPATTDRFWPQSLYNFLTREHERFMACHVGSIGNRSLSWQ